MVENQFETERKQNLFGSIGGASQTALEFQVGFATNSCCYAVVGCCQEGDLHVYNFRFALEAGSILLLRDDAPNEPYSHYCANQGNARAPPFVNDIMGA